MPEFIEQFDETTKATLLRRVAAMFYDFLLNIAILMVTTGIYMLSSKRLIGDGAYKAMNESGATIGDPLLTAILFSVLFVFYGYFWTKTGQTLGMQVWHIRVQTTNGERISWAQAFKRFVGAFLSVSIFGLGYLWLLIDKNNKTLQCYLSNTQVIRIPKRSK